MRKLSIVLGVILLVAFIGWQVMAPWMAMDTLRDAARDGDRLTLEQNIDFPALRASVKSEVYDQVKQEAGRKGPDDVFGAVLGSTLAKGVIGGMVDAVVTPDGVSTLLVSGNALPRPGAADKQPEIDWHVKWVGFGSFRAVPDTKDGKSHPSLIFRRDGLSWKLAGIDIPDV